MTTQNGITIRVAVKGIRSQSRNTLGVRVIRLDEGDEVRDAVILEAPVEGDGETVPVAELPSPDGRRATNPTTTPEEETRFARPPSRRRRGRRRGGRRWARRPTRREPPSPDPALPDVRLDRGSLLSAGSITGQVYHCLDCQYIGSLDLRRWTSPTTARPLR